MSHRFTEQLEELKSRLSRMGALVQQSVERSIEALLALDTKLAQQVIDADQKIDEEEVQVEKGAIDLLALHQPAAGDLRLITTIIKANSDFERVADCAVNIAQRVLPLSRHDGYEVPADMKIMANSVIGTLRDTIKAFNLSDEAVARHVLRGDDVVDALYHQIVQDTLTQMEGEGEQRADADVNLANIMIAKNLERIGDHCTNIAEDVIFVRLGRIVRHLHAVL
jgi:phosphate transport system protein